jgi:hypothetical protein
MKVSISSVLSEPVWAKIAELKDILEKGAYADSYSAERRHLAKWFQDALDGLNAALEQIKAGEDPYQTFFELRKDKIYMGVESSLMRHILELLKPSAVVKNKSQIRTPAPMYNRLRWLWKNKSSSLNAWELQFVESVGPILRAGKTLSEKQRLAVEKLFAKYQVPFDATASEYTSTYSLGDTVQFVLAGKELYGNILAVAFMPGKVLYTIACFTGFKEPELSEQYGQVNSIGWDEQGFEYLRIPNVDSIYVVGRASRIGCRCPQAAEQTCFIGDDSSCPRKTPQFRLEQSSTRPAQN